MSNYIKIPISTDTGIPLATTGAIVDTSNWDFSAISTVTASQSSGPLSSSVLPAGGSGATFTFTTDGASVISVAVNNAGDGYSVGDVITVSVPAGGINGDGSAKDVTITLTLAMLADTASTPEEIIPVDDILALDIDGDNIKLMTSNVSASGAVCFWTVELDLDGGVSAELGQEAIDIAWRKAVQSENSQPSVVFPDNIAAYNVTYTTT